MPSISTAIKRMGRVTSEILTAERSSGQWLVVSRRLHRTVSGCLAGMQNGSCLLTASPLVTSHCPLATAHCSMLLLYFAKPWDFCTHYCFRGIWSCRRLRLSTSFVAVRTIISFGSFSLAVGLGRWFIFLPKFCLMPGCCGSLSGHFLGGAESANSRPLC